ncbi:MAG: dihydrofolate reductase [Flavobacteriales bacterium]|nr:dihydrofolate reductase [Flavobacteriales bacterium]
MEENTPSAPEITTTRVAMIAAIGRNRELGKNNELLWHINEDMQFFKDTTIDHYVIMGRKSFDSIPKKYKPLPNRVNVIISRNPDFMYEECYTCASIEEGIELAVENGEPMAFIIGGGEIYRQAIEKNLVDEMFLTHVDASFADADTFFPAYDHLQWEKELIRTIPADSQNEFPCEIWHYRKK